jgi:hypothetical protein
MAKAFPHIPVPKFSALQLALAEVCAKEIWNGAFSPIQKKKDKFKNIISDKKGKPSDKELYARVIADAKKKFEVYPSAYANGWVVQEYKRRGGKYN